MLPKKERQKERYPKNAHAPKCAAVWLTENAIGPLCFPYSQTHYAVARGRETARCTSPGAPTPETWPPRAVQLFRVIFEDF